MLHLGGGYQLPVLLILIGVSAAYVIRFRRTVLDIPVALRFFLSVVPAVVLYRAVFSLGMLLFLDARPIDSRLSQPWLFGFFTVVTVIASLVVYHIWRDVSLEDLKWRQQSDVAPLLEPSSRLRE
jgi:hypothetical protein